MLFDLALQHALDGCSVALINSARTLSWRVVAGSQVRGHHGKANGDRARGGDRDIAPEAHVFVGRQRVPIDEGDGEIVRAAGGKISMASALVPPGLAAAVTSNSKSRQAPAILSAAAICLPFSQRWRGS